MIVHITCECQRMREDIVKKKVIRVFFDIGVRRRGDLVLIRSNEDKMSANAIHWSEKSEFEQREKKSKQNLFDAHEKLVKARQTITKLKTMLDNERRSNIQLVHWKAINMKVIEDLHRQIQQFHDDYGLDISKLVDKLYSAHEEVAALRIETDEIESYADRTVRKTIEEIDSLRKTNFRHKTNLIQKQSISQCGFPSKNEIDYFSSGVFEQLKESNAVLSEENDRLRRQICELEEKKKKNSVEVLATMEEVTKQRSKSRLYKSLRKTGTIMKPTLPTKTIPR